MKQLEADGLAFPLVHMANSDGINNFPESWFDLVRTGINLYGVFDLQGIRAYHLAPSLTLKSTLLQRRLLPAGSTIGYGGTHALFRFARGVPELHPGYRPARRYDDAAPGVFNPDGLRARVGASHVPLGEFVSAFTSAGLRVEHFEEDGEDDYPYLVALVARR